MMLRSSSTPILGSLMSSESPNNNNSHTPSHSFHYNFNNTNNKLPSYQSHQTSSRHNFHSSSNYHSSPISHSVADLSNHGTPQKGIRRAQSESNLAELTSVSFNDHSDEFDLSLPPKSFAWKKSHYTAVLQPIPSFSSRNQDGEEEYSDDYDDVEEEKPELQNPSKEERIVAMNGDKIGFEEMNVKAECGTGFGNYVAFKKGTTHDDVGSEMHIARGFGIGFMDGFGGGGGAGSGDANRLTGPGRGGDAGATDEANDMEEHYKSLVDKNPGNAMVLRNYADFLQKTKNDLKGAEEYYSRSILADPTDGEVFSQYAKIVWELHHDIDRATSYFERAVQIAPADSHVHAAYANFLWETEDEDDELLDIQKDLNTRKPEYLRQAGMVSTAGA